MRQILHGYLHKNIKDRFRSRHAIEMPLVHLHWVLLTVVDLILGQAFTHVVLISKFRIHHRTGKKLNK